MPRVDVPDYKTFVDFPDGTPPEEMQSVLAKQFPKKPSFIDNVVRGPLARVAQGVNSSLGGALSAFGLDAGAKSYQEGAEYWKQKADAAGSSGIPAQIYEGLGGAPMGVAEFVAGVPYAAAKGAVSGYREDGVTGALKEGALEAVKRAGIGKVFHGIGNANLTPLQRTGAMAGTMGAQTAAEGGSLPDAVAATATGALLMPPSGGGAQSVVRSRLQRAGATPEIAADLSGRFNPDIQPAGMGSINTNNVDTMFASDPARPPAIRDSETIALTGNESRPSATRGPVLDAENASRISPYDATGPAPGISIEVARLKQEHPYWSDAEYLKEAVKTTLTQNPETLPAATDMSTIRPATPQPVRQSEDAPGLRRGVPIGNQDMGQRFGTVDRISDPVPPSGMLLNPEVLPARTDFDRYEAPAPPAERPAENAPSRTVEPQSMESGVTPSSAKQPGEMTRDEYDISRLSQLGADYTASFEPRNTINSGLFDPENKSLWRKPDAAPGFFTHELTHAIVNHLEKNNNELRNYDFNESEIKVARGLSGDAKNLGYDGLQQRREYKDEAIRGILNNDARYISAFPGLAKIVGGIEDPAVKIPLIPHAEQVRKVEASFNHDSLPTAAVTAADSLVLQDAAPQLKIAVVGTPAEIKALGKQPTGKTTWVSGDKAYIIDVAAAREKYGSVLETKRALKEGGDAESEALGYPPRGKSDVDTTVNNGTMPPKQSGGGGMDGVTEFTRGFKTPEERGVVNTEKEFVDQQLQTAAVTKAGEILTEPESIKQAATAGDVAYAAEGAPADLAAKIEPVADALSSPVYSIKVKVGDAIEDRFAVPAPERMGFKRGHGDELYKTRAEAETAYKQQVENEARLVESESKRVESERAAEQKRAEREDIGSFGADLPPVQLGKVKAALLARQRFNGVEMTRKDSIEKMIKDGYKIGDWKGERTLVDPEGAFFTQKQITKTGLDYAQHLLDTKPPESVKTFEQFTAEDGYRSGDKFKVTIGGREYVEYPVRVDKDTITVDVFGNKTVPISDAVLVKSSDRRRSAYEEYRRKAEYVEPAAPGVDPRITKLAELSGHTEAKTIEAYESAVRTQGKEKADSMLDDNIVKYSKGDFLPVGTTGKSASDWANDMAYLQSTKPRPLDRLYGKNGPTPEQKIEYTERKKQWEKDYRNASKNQKIALEEDNAAFRVRQQPADPQLLHAGVHLPTLVKQAKDTWKHYTEKLSTDAPAGSLKAGFDANRKANAAFGKKPLFDWLRREGIDVQANAQNELMRLGPEAVWARRQNDAISGATAKSGLVKERFRKEAMGGMSLRERQAMSDMVAIDNDLGITKPGYTKIFGKTDAELRAARSAFQTDYKLTDAETARVENATRQYFDAWKGRTQRMLDAGLIDAAQKQALDARDYSPKQLLEKIDPDTMQNMGGNRVSVPDSGIKRLKGGSDGYFRNDPVALLEEATDRIETRIARNEANQALAALPVGNGVATPAVRIGADKFAPAPPGFDQISYMVKGRREALNVRADFAAEWHRADPLANSQLVDAMGWVSGASAVRAGSTGHNPLFALVNMPVDAITIWMQADKSGYSTHPPVAAAQMARNLVKVAGDAWKHEGRYENWVNEKGARELLSNYGGITNRRAHLKPALQKISDITSKIGRFSEEVSRLAYREQLIKNGVPPAEASLMAGEYVDFSRGGGLLKAVDRLGLPYLNAGMQGARSIGRSAGRDPAAFAIKTAYLLAGASALYGFNQMVNPTGWANTSDREKADNFIIMTPPYFNYIDKDGTEVALYFRIKKEQSMRPFLSMAEALWQKTHESKDASQQVKMAFGGAVPLSASQLLPPVAKMYLAYATNTDVYKQEPVWKGKQEIAPFAEYTNQTNPILTGVGKLTATTGKDGQLEGGVSPERLGRSLQQVFVPGNLFTKMGVGALTEAYEKMNPSDRVKFAASNYDKVVQLARGSRLLGGAKDTEQFREGIRDARTGTATQQFEVNKTLDAMVLRYVKTGKSDAALYDRITNFVESQSGESRARLENRIEGLVETADLPDRGWWMSVRALQPEDRADQFKARLKSATPDEQQRMLEIADGLSGFVSDRFLDQYEREE